MRLHHCYIAVNKASKSEAVTPVPPHSSSSTFASHHVLISHDFCLLLFLFVFHNMISQLFINTSSHVLSTDASVEQGLIASMRVINCLGDEFMTTKLLPPPSKARESLSDAMRRENSSLNASNVSMKIQSMPTAILNLSHLIWGKFIIEGGRPPEAINLKRR